MMSLWDALRMNMMISYQELVRTFPIPFPNFRSSLKSDLHPSQIAHVVPEAQVGTPEARKY